MSFYSHTTILTWLWTSVSSTSFQWNWNTGSDWERYWLEEELWPSKRKRCYRFSSLRNLRTPWCKVEPSSRSPSQWGEKFFSEWLCKRQTIKELSQVWINVYQYIFNWGLNVCAGL